MAKAWLGLGGNIGDVVTALSSALQLIDNDPDTSVLSVSSVYKTPPWGVEDQPWFNNCCAELSTKLSPEELLELCQTVERAGNRERKERWGPRTIDVDILIYEGVEQTEQRLTIPHPRMKERAFVLVPLAELAPDQLLGRSPVSELAELTDSQDISLVDLSANWWR